MRKTNIALLVAVVVSSPIALAEGYDYDNGYNYENGSNSGSDYDRKHKNTDKDIIVKDSFNKKQIDKDVTITKTINSDDDKLILHDVKNDKSRTFTDNSTWEYSNSWTIDIDTDYFVAQSDLDGYVTFAEVSYGGGACCKYGHQGSSTPNTVTVDQINHMNNSFGGAAGVNMAAQNAGNNSLVQQSASTNATFNGQ